MNRFQVFAFIVLPVVLAVGGHLLVRHTEWSERREARTAHRQEGTGIPRVGVRPRGDIGLVLVMLAMLVCGGIGGLFLARLWPT